MTRTIGVSFGAALITLGAAASAQQATVGLVEIGGDLSEQPAPYAVFGGGSPTLRDYTDTFAEIAEQGTLDGLVLRLKDAALGTTQVEELGAAIDHLQRSGVRVHVFAEQFGPGELLLGAYADSAVLQKGGSVSLPGIYLEEMFLGDTLSWAGLRADFVQVGKYKGADEMLTRAEPSDPWDENISGLLDGMYREMRGVLTRGRGLTERELDRAMEEAWLASGQTAIEAGLIDAEADLLDVVDYVAAEMGEEAVEYTGEISVGGGDGLDTSNPFAVFAQLFEPPTRTTSGPTIAVLHVNGAIVDGDSQPAGPLGGGASVGSRTLRRAMQDIAADENIRGVVVRIDSPGGSATASEVIWQGLRRLAEDRPVWASVGGMAASGGYYVAVGTQKIYVNPSSIVGSIGVVGGKISMGELFDRVELNVVERTRGPRAGLFSTVSGWDEAQKAYVRGKMAETYEQFTDRVTTGRPAIDLSRTAEGRLFVGADAIDLAMADEVGGLAQAIDAMAIELGLSSYDVLDFPAPKSLDEVLEDTFGGFVAAPEIGALLREALGAERFGAVVDQLNAVSLLREQPVLLTMPRAILIRR